MAAAPEPVDLAAFDPSKLSFSAPKASKVGNNTTGVSVSLNYSGKPLYVKTPVFMKAPFGVSSGYNGGGEKKEVRVETTGEAASGKPRVLTDTRTRFQGDSNKKTIDLDMPVDVPELQTMRDMLNAVDAAAKAHIRSEASTIFGEAGLNLKGKVRICGAMFCFELF